MESGTLRLNSSAPPLGPMAKVWKQQVSIYLGYWGYSVLLSKASRVLSQQFCVITRGTRQLIVDGPNLHEVLISPIPRVSPGMTLVTWT
jgi:hypothetical protein